MEVTLTVLAIFSFLITLISYYFTYSYKKHNTKFNGYTKEVTTAICMSIVLTIITVLLFRTILNHE